MGSVGDTAGADQTSPEDHEPAEDGAAEGVLLTLVCRRESMCVCACVRVCQKREVKGKRRHGLLPWRKGSWTRQAMFPGDQGLPSQLDRYHWFPSSPPHLPSLMYHTYLGLKVFGRNCLSPRCVFQKAMLGSTDEQLLELPLGEYLPPPPPPPPPSPWQQAPPPLSLVVVLCTREGQAGND